MKLLVMSDTHGRTLHAERAINRLSGSVEAVVHLGDMLSDALALEARCSLPFHLVAGNCDFYGSPEYGLPEHKLLEINGVKILLTHGHADGVKNGYTRLAERAKKSGASVALSGHTHEPFVKEVDGVLCVNPGSASYPRRGAHNPSCAVLNIPDSVVEPPSANIVEITPNSPE